MEVAGYLFLTLLGSGVLMNKHEKTKQAIKKPKVNEEQNGGSNAPCPPQLPLEFGEYVTPYFYNTLELTGASNKIPNSNYRPDLIRTGLNKQVEDELRIFSLSENSQVFSPLNKPNSTKKSGWETVDTPSKYESVPHDETHLDETEMTHTNMVPFYKGNITQNVDPENRLNAHKLELFTGTYHLRKNNKEEVEPFFAPTTGMTNIYGHHEKRELDRYKPNNTGKKNNELPFNQVRVGSGLNGGFTAAPSGGFHDPTRILPKRNDQLYVNPKSEMKGKINHGKAPVENRPLTAVQYKYKPTLLVENKCGERNFTTTGQVKGRKLRPSVVLRDTNRKRHTKIMGHATPGETHYNRPENLFAKVQRTKKTNYENTPFRNAAISEGKLMNDLGRGGYENKPNERTVTGTRTYTSNLTYFVNKIMSKFTDNAKYTRKQEYINHARPYGNMQIKEGGKFKAYDPKDVARTTVRETTENNDRVGGTGKLGAGRGKSYDPRAVARTTVRETTENNDRVGGTGKLGAGRGKAYDPRAVARTTTRETTENNDRVGGTGKLGAGRGKAYDPRAVARTTTRETTENNDRVGGTGKLGAGRGKAYDPRAVARTTTRETTENNDRVGGTGKLGAGQGKAYDPTDVAKTTIKETTIDSNRRGVVSNAIQKKSIAYDPRNVTKTTIRETTENKNRPGIVSHSLKKNSIAYDPTDVARTTVKETTIHNSRNGNVAGGEFQNGGGYKVNNVYANNTNRQFTQDYYWSPAADAATQKNAMNYDAAYNAEINPIKEIIAEGREPTKQSVKLNNRIANMENYEVKKIEGDEINWRGNIKTSGFGDYYNPNAISKCTNTSIKNHLPEDSTRFDTQILDAYKNNPLTQSLQSYA